MTDDDRDATRIRVLFDRVMDDAPPAPDLIEIEARRALRHEPRATQRWTPAVAATLAAATVIGLLVLVVPRRDPEPTIDRVATTAADPETSTPLATNPDSRTPTTPTPAATSGVPSSASPSESPSEIGTAVVVANDDGVTIVADDSTANLVIAEPTVTARSLADGRVVALLAASNTTDDPANEPGSIVIWDPATDQETVVDVPNPTAGTLELHDVATVEGVATILYTHGPAVCDIEADECNVALRTFEPDTERSTELLSLNGGRNQWTNLSLADTGIIVGEIAGPDGINFHSSLAGLDITAPMPLAANLGLSPSPTGCGDCPRGYRIDPTGRHVAWIEGTDLVIVDLQAPRLRATAPSVLPEGVENGDVIVDLADVVLTKDDVITARVIVGVADATESTLIEISDGTATSTPTDSAALLR